MVWTCVKGGQYISRRMLRFGRGRQEAKRKTKEEIYGLVKEDLRSVVLREEDAEDGVRWRQMIGCGLLKGWAKRRQSRRLSKSLLIRVDSHWPHPLHLAFGYKKNLSYTPCRVAMLLALTSDNRSVFAWRDIKQTGWLGILETLLHRRESTAILRRAHPSIRSLNVSESSREGRYPLSLTAKKDNSSTQHASTDKEGVLNSGSNNRPSCICKLEIWHSHLIYSTDSCTDNQYFWRCSLE